LTWHHGQDCEEWCVRDAAARRRRCTEVLTHRRTPSTHA
jgi:hypothetical protein